MGGGGGWGGDTVRVLTARQQMYPFQRANEGVVQTQSFVHSSLYVIDIGHAVLKRPRN